MLTRYVHDVHVDVIAPQDNERYEDHGKPRYDPEDAVAQGSTAGQQFEVKGHSHHVSYQQWHREKAHRPDMWEEFRESKVVSIN